MGLIARNIPAHPPHFHPETLLRIWVLYLPAVPVMLAGAGIKTQPTLRTMKGLHGSMYFTLSLPVSRLRLLAVRAGLGMLETVGVVAAIPYISWAMVPALRGVVPVSDLFAYSVSASICVSSFYFLSVLFATFFDDLWQIWGSFVAILGLWWLSSRVSVPTCLNIFQAIGGASSPLLTHTVPWATMGVSLGAAAILFLAALRVVQTREY